MTTKITYKKARATVAKVVREKGSDHKYQPSMGLYSYFDDNGGCIVGNALAKWEVTEEDLGIESRCGGARRCETPLAEPQSVRERLGRAVLLVAHRC